MSESLQSVITEEISKNVKDHGIALVLCIAATVYSAYKADQTEGKLSGYQEQQSVFLQEKLLTKEQATTDAVQSQAISNAQIATVISDLKSLIAGRDELVKACQEELRANRIVMMELLKEMKAPLPSSLQEP